MRQRQRHDYGEQSDLPADGVGHRLRRALVRHLDDIESRRLLEQFHLLLADGAGAGGRIRKLARIRLGIGDQLLHTGKRRAGMRRQHQRNHPHLGDRHKIFQRIVLRLGAVAGHDDEGVGDDQDRVAIRR